MGTIFISCKDKINNNYVDILALNKYFQKKKTVKLVGKVYWTKI